MLDFQQAAITIIREELKKEPLTTTRFQTGLDNYVFKVELKDERPIVVRLNALGKESQYNAAVYWYKQLEPAHIPLPTLLKYNTTPGTLPYMIMEFVDGKDLGEIFSTLSTEEKKQIALSIAAIQQSVIKTLPQGPGYGFADTYEATNLHQDWTAVLHAHLDRSRRWIEAVGLVDPILVERVRERLSKYQSYFSQIKPVPFLHDTTTKNVLVSGGEIRGIVDVDSICFGDPLFVPALTKMSLLSMGESTEYIQYWCDALGVTPEAKTIVDVYTAMFCVNFLGEIGQRFNKDAIEEANSSKNKEQKTKLESILDTILKQI